MSDTDFYEIVREHERRRITGISRTTWWRLERRGKAPRSRQLTDNTIGWFRGELLEFNQNRPTVRDDSPEIWIAGPQYRQGRNNLPMYDRSGSGNDEV